MKDSARSVIMFLKFVSKRWGGASHYLNIEEIKALSPPQLIVLGLSWLERTHAGICRILSHTSVILPVCPWPRALTLNVSMDQSPWNRQKGQEGTKKGGERWKSVLQCNYQLVFSCQGKNLVMHHFPGPLDKLNGDARASKECLNSWSELERWLSLWEKC